MNETRIPKHSKITGLVSTFSFLLCFLLSTAASAGKIEDIREKKTITILQKIKELCKQYSARKKVDALDHLDNQEVYQPIPIKDSSSKKGVKPVITQPIEPAADDAKSETVLDEYEEIKDFYAYDPAIQVWVQIKSFQIVCTYREHKPIDPEVDWTIYINFWAYDLPSQEWHKVSLIRYLQQANTQINNDSPAIVTNKSVLRDDSSKLNGAAFDELLEELLGVHTFTMTPNPQQEHTIWSNFSFDCSIGMGAVWYENNLMHMRLVQREGHDYFFVTKNHEVYKPNWFYHMLDKVIDFNQVDHVAYGRSYQSKFKGKGFALPITLGVQYIFWEQLLVGAGREMVFNYTNKLVHNDSAIKHKEFIMHKKWSTQGRWFVKCGWYAFPNEKHRFFGDIRLFYLHHFGNMLRNMVTFGPYVHQALAYNVGVGYEQQLTDYLSCTSRLAMEWQSFKQFSGKKSYDIVYNQPAIYLQMGLSMRCTKHDSSNKNLKKLDGVCQKHKLDGIKNPEKPQDLLDLG